jgi:hypothetical protein
MARKITIPHVARRDLRVQYREAAKDAVREAEARTWSEGLITPFR